MHTCCQHELGRDCVGAPLKTFWSCPSTWIRLCDLIDNVLTMIMEFESETPGHGLSLSLFFCNSSVCCLTQMMTTMYHFSPMDLISFCALLQTQQPGPIGSIMLNGRHHPLHILAMIASLMISMLLATIFVSTVTFIRKTRSNKILPHRRIIRRRQKQLRRFGSRTISHKRSFVTREDPDEIENVNCNNNVCTTDCQSHHPHHHHHHHPQHPHHYPQHPHHHPVVAPPSIPPPPPSLHRPPSERQWAPPPYNTNAGLVKPKRPIKTKESHVNSALVSELKMKFEQRRLNQQHWLRPLPMNVNAAMWKVCIKRWEQVNISPEGRCFFPGMSLWSWTMQWRYQTRDGPFHGLGSWQTGSCVLFRPCSCLCSTRLGGEPADMDGWFGSMQ